MNGLKITTLSVILLLLAVVSAQEYFDDYDSETDLRTKRDADDFVVQDHNKHLKNRENIRFRRDVEVPRHRRQGNHGNGGGGGHEGITGPVHTFVKTDEHAHFKWGVRHHVGHEYAGRR